MAFQPTDDTATIGIKRKFSKANENDDDNDVDLLDDENVMNPAKRHTNSQRMKR